MKIDSSVVAMSSERSYASGEQTKISLKTIGQKKDKTEAVSLEAEQTSLEASESEEYMLSISQKAREKAQQLQDGRLGRIHDRLMGKGLDLTRLSEEMEISLIEQILNALDQAEGRKPRFKSRNLQSTYRAAQEANASIEQLSAKVQGMSASGGRMSAGRVSGMGESEAFYRFSMRTSYVESESTSFTARGVAKTADGREISFDVEINMTREFSRTTSVYSAQLTEDMRLIDPLVINVGADVASVRNQKFTFDINADGKADKISKLGSGSGFLALDKNGNGAIDDGSELFGAKTGDGFGELAEYDGDGNGWIDENDAVFNDLRVWVQDEDGSNRLVALAEADVGAIYLGSAGTKFSLTNQNNGTNAVIQRSGVFLKESGGVGTVQHVDFAL